jgi:hypothetical protein
VRDDVQEVAAIGKLLQLGRETRSMMFERAVQTEGRNKSSQFPPQAAADVALACCIAFSPQVT